MWICTNHKTTRKVAKERYNICMDKGVSIGFRGAESEIGNHANSSIFGLDKRVPRAC